MGCDSPQNFALDERLANQTKLEMFQIPQTAVDQLARRTGGRRGEIIFLAKIHRPAASGGVSGDSAAVNAASDDGDVKGRPRRRRGLHSPSPKPKRAEHRSFEKCVFRSFRGYNERVAQGKRKNELSNEYNEAPA